MTSVRFAPRATRGNPPCLGGELQWREVNYIIHGLSSGWKPMSILEALLTGMLRLPLLGAGVERSLCGLRRAATGAMRRYARDRVRPREWSNAELRKFAPQFSGPVINVSGWRDEDKTGGHYRDYFPAASDYAVSNYSGERGICRGHGGE